MKHIYFHPHLKSYFMNYVSERDIFHFPLKIAIGNINERSIEEIECSIFEENREYIDRCLDDLSASFLERGEYCIWFSNDSNEYCCYIYLIHLLSQYRTKIYAVDCSKPIVEDSGVYTVYNHSGELTKESFMYFLNTFEILENKDIEIAMKHYTELKNSNGHLSILNNSKLKFYTYEDLYNDILSYTDDYRRIIDIIVFIKEKYNLNNEENIIIYIINQLIENKRIIKKVDDYYFNIQVKRKKCE